LHLFNSTCWAVPGTVVELPQGAKIPAELILQHSSSGRPLVLVENIQAFGWTAVPSRDEAVSPKHSVT
ncbi:hypothetical protein HK405_002759, partial [Cladochytrium tenue]